MEYVSCPVCGEDNARPLWIKHDVRYVRCNACSLVYENPRLTEQELIEFYSDKSYFIKESDQAETSGYENYFAQCTQSLREEYFALIERYTQTTPGRYCDVGCGTGGVLRVAQERGWEAIGVEVSSWAVQEGTKAGLDIRQGSLRDAQFPDDHFDAVSMFDVLEHLTSPRPYVQEIHRILKPGGVLLIETPNVDGFFAQYIYREHADLVKPRAHICLYGPRSAKRLLVPAGFSTVRIMTFPYCRRITLGYLKSVVTSRILPGRTPVQLTFNDSLRIVCRK